MTHADAVSSRLGAGSYRFRDGQWEHRDEDGWASSSVLDGHGYDEGVAAVAACGWASLVEEDDLAPPVNEYERLHRQKVAILAAQESEKVRLLKRNLVDASETIAFWKQHAHRLAHEKGVLRAEHNRLQDVLRLFVGIDNGYCTACHGFWKADGNLGEHRPECPIHLLRDEQQRVQP